MLFLLSLAAFILIPFALLAMLPIRIGGAMVGGLALAAVAFGLATAGSDFPILPVSLMVSGLVMEIVWPAREGSKSTVLAPAMPWAAVRRWRREPVPVSLVLHTVRAPAMDLLIPPAGWPSNKIWTGFAPKVCGPWPEAGLMKPTL